MCNSEAMVSICLTLYLVMEPALLGNVATTMMLSDTQILCFF